MLISYKGLVANYHKGITPNSKLVIRAGGMPVLPKDYDDKDFSMFFAGGRDVVLPEYYGSFRSSGEFTGENCFQTLIGTYEHFQGGEALDIYGKKSIQVRYDTIVLLGASFGGYFVSRLASKLQTPAIGLIYPMLTSMNDNRGVPEESDDDVEFLLRQGGLERLYNIPQKKWHNFSSQLESDHMQCIKGLENTPVFLAHGSDDTCIHVSRSQEFYTDLASRKHSDYNMYLEIPKAGHGSKLKPIVVPEFVKWLNSII